MAMDMGLSRLIGFSVDIAVSVLYSVLFVLATRKRVKSHGALGLIPAVLTIMFFLNTAQLVLQGVDIYRAFFVWSNVPGGAQAYFFDCSNGILPARDAILWILSFITDGLIIWRLFVVWLCNVYIIILPCLLLIAGLGTGMVMYYFTIGRMLENSMRLTPEIDKWWIITLGFTIAVNLVTPGLIIIRLWWIARKVGVIGSRSSRPYKQIAYALMESGSLYTVAATGHLVIFACGFYPALWMSGCILPTIIACVPCLIVLRITNSPPKQGLQLRYRPSCTSNFEVESRVHISDARQTSIDCPKPPGLEVQDSVFRPWSTKSDVGVGS